MSFGTSKGSSYTAPTTQHSTSTSDQWMKSVSAPSSELYPQSSALLGEAAPVGADFQQMLLAAMRGELTGGLKNVANVGIEGTKRATSKSLTSLDEYLAQSGLGGTPFAAGERTKATREGELATEQVAPTLIAALLQMVAPYLSSTRQAGISGLSVPTTTSESSGTTVSQSHGGGGEATQKQTGPWGMSCAITTAAQGYPHPAVRLYRARMPRRTLRGYYRLAEWLVPWMHRSRMVMFLSRTLMTRPLTAYCAHVEGYVGYGVLCTPIAHIWRFILYLLGSDAPFKRSSGEVI